MNHKPDDRSTAYTKKGETLLAKLQEGNYHGQDDKERNDREIVVGLTRQGDKVSLTFELGNIHLFRMGNYH